jgi:hypothetical protein
MLRYLVILADFFVSCELRVRKPEEDMAHRAGKKSMERETPAERRNGWARFDACRERR